MNKIVMLLVLLFTANGSLARRYRRDDTNTEMQAPIPTTPPSYDVYNDNNSNNKDANSMKDDNYSKESEHDAGGMSSEESNDKSSVESSNKFNGGSSDKSTGGFSKESNEISIGSSSGESHEIEQLPAPVQTPLFLAYKALNMIGRIGQFIEPFYNIVSYIPGIGTSLAPAKLFVTTAYSVIKTLIFPGIVRGLKSIFNILSTIPNLLSII